MAWKVEARRWAPAAAVLLLAGSMMGACAKGIDDTSTDDGGSGASGATGGMGSTGTMGGGGGSGGATSTQASSSSTGTPCDEMPCKLIAPQCGCAMDEKCALDNQGMRICEPEGAVATGDQCLGSNCSAGNQCLATFGLGMCREFCDDDSQCSGPGGLCALEVNDGNGGTWPDKFCSENCDPVTSTGCGPTNAKCELGREAAGQMRYFTLCVGSGASGQGATCMDTGDCAQGLGCFTTNPGPPEVRQCLTWCQPAAPNCPGGTTCSSFNPAITLGTIEYGACL